VACAFFTCQAIWYFAVGTFVTRVLDALTSAQPRRRAPHTLAAVRRSRRWSSTKCPGTFLFALRHAGAMLWLVQAQPDHHGGLLFAVSPVLSRLQPGVCVRRSVSTPCVFWHRPRSRQSHRLCGHTFLLPVVEPLWRHVALGACVVAGVGGWFQVGTRPHSNRFSDEAS
jgi:hypothetical protein